MIEEQKQQRIEENMQSRSVISQIIPARFAGEEKGADFDKEQAKAFATKMSVANLNFFYGRTRALKNISLTMPANQVTAFIGPSGCGKSTLLRTLNRMNDIIPGSRVEGRVELDGENIYAPSTDVVSLRRRIGMVFQKSN